MLFSIVIAVTLHLSIVGISSGVGSLLYGPAAQEIIDSQVAAANCVAPCLKPLTASC